LRARRVPLHDRVSLREQVVQTAPETIEVVGRPVAHRLSLERKVPDDRRRSVDRPLTGFRAEVHESPLDGDDRRRDIRRPAGRDLLNLETGHIGHGGAGDGSVAHDDAYLVAGLDLAGSNAAVGRRFTGKGDARLDVLAPRQEGGRDGNSKPQPGGSRSR